jgi:hypothetical protein
MPAEALAFVQFIHPGNEHGPDSGGDVKSWNRGSHRRKFLLADGAYLLDGKRREGRIAFWGEWEPPSRVVARYPAEGDLPRFVHEPFLERPSSFRGLQNTDPYVFGDRFLYTGCQQHTNGGRTETQLRRLSRGSLILFGSCRDLSRFVVDTVFVVAWYVDHSFRDHEDLLREVVNDEYRTVTLGPWYAEGDGEMSFRLYLGATPNDPVEGMFSFVPCVPADGDVDPRFPRPEIRIPGAITSHLRQGKKITKIEQLQGIATLWREVVHQTERQGLAIATRIGVPRARLAPPALRQQAPRTGAAAAEVASECG